MRNEKETWFTEFTNEVQLMSPDSSCKIGPKLSFTGNILTPVTFYLTLRSFNIVMIHVTKCKDFLKTS